jgi:isoquinoline 1-oxidoreductase beta subunit
MPDDLMPLAAAVPSRRRFIQAASVIGGALVVGFRLPFAKPARAAASGAFVPNAFVRVAPDGTVTVIAKHIEFGQGTHTGLATILAEEMDADWKTVQVEAAPADAAIYNNLLFGPFQGTGGSTAMANSWEQLRRAGATARAMLVAAAATEWGVPAAEITVAAGVVSHSPSGKSAGFGDLVAAAAGIPVPADVPLKDASAFSLVGHDVARVDVPSKVDGSAVFTLDLKLPGMLTALVRRPGRFGATVRSFDGTAAKAVKGVVGVVAVPSGVAVIATGFWAAKKGRDALVVEWDESAAETRGSRQMLDAYAEQAKTPGLPVRSEGDAGAALSGAARTLEAVFEFPYLAHAPMEPLDCVIQLRADGADIWAGSQTPTVDQAVAASILGFQPQQVNITTLFAGGSFGRRATAVGDFASEAAHIAKAFGGAAPIRLVWTREDDIKGGMYRPLYVHRLRAGLDAAGNLVAWEQRIVGQSILAGTPFEAFLVKDGIDGTSVEGAANLPYAIPDLQVELHTMPSPVTVLWWRSVGHTHTAYAIETFIDELAEAAGRDPVEFRRAMIAEHAPRVRGVLDLVAEKAGWGTPVAEGRARGVAVVESFGSFVAQVVEVSMGAERQPKIERVVCAVDCGTAINPDNIRAQMEGGIGFGLGATLHGEISLEDGRVVQSNFDDYRPLRIEEMPAVEVHILPSDLPPTGAGEPGVPPIGPALANAWAKLTGERIRSLPFRRRSVS